MKLLIFAGIILWGVFYLGRVFGHGGTGIIAAVLSDLHLGSLLGERWLAARVAQVNAQQPDVVVLLGL
jgi:hypothetical protein